MNTKQDDKKKGRASQYDSGNAPAKMKPSVTPEAILKKQRSFTSDLRAKLRRYRLENDLTQKGMAELLGVGQTTIAQFEGGTTLLRRLQRPDQWYQRLTTKG